MGEQWSPNIAPATTYTVTLTVTDNEGATGNTSRTVTVSDAAGNITLTVSLQGKVSKRNGLQKIKLGWNGATTGNVDVWKDVEKIATTANDGTYTDSVLPTGTYVYKVCEENTDNCSDGAPVYF